MKPSPPKSWLIAMKKFGQLTRIGSTPRPCRRLASYRVKRLGGVVRQARKGDVLPHRKRRHQEIGGLKEQALTGRKAKGGGRRSRGGHEDEAQKIIGDREVARVLIGDRGCGGSP